MGVIAIVDTGIPNIYGSGSAVVSTEMANAGAEMQLKTAEMSWNRGVGISNNPNPANYADAELQFSSFDNPKITIKGVLDRTITADMTLLKQLDRLCTTKGVKLLYYTSTSDGYRDLTDSLGTTDAAHATVSNYTSGTTPHLHVIFTGFSIPQPSTGKLLTYNLTGEVTG